MLFEKFRDKEYIGNPINIQNSVAHLLLIEQLLQESNLTSINNDIATSVLSTLFFLFANNSALAAPHHIRHWKNILIATCSGASYYARNTTQTLWKYVESNLENLTAALLACSVWNELNRPHPDWTLPCSDIFVVKIKGLRFLILCRKI